MKKCIFAGVLCLLLAAAAFAQAKRPLNQDPNTRSVEGVVVDNSDNPVNGAVVQLKDTKTLQVRSFYTRDDGAYHFAGLSTNVDYELKADMNGKSSGTRNLSVYDGRRTAVVNLKLK